jgi:5-methylcytosine-specific restriction protein A
MRTIAEWIGTSDDQAVPPRVELRIFQKHNGICPICTHQLRPGQWDCDHIVALCNGGQHRENNLQPVCRAPCHRNKTKADRRIKAKADRSGKLAAGIKKPRTIRAWRKFDGTPVYASRER